MTDRMDTEALRTGGSKMIGTTTEAVERLALTYDERVKTHDDLTGACANLRSERGKGIRDLHENTANTLRSLAAEVLELRAERDGLRSSALAIQEERDAVIRARDEALALHRKAEDELAAEKALSEHLAGDLFGIEVYASDTLSGPSEGVPDLKWCMDGVAELHHRSVAGRAAYRKARGL